MREGHEVGQEGHQNREPGLGEAFHIHDLALREEHHQGIPAEGSPLRGSRHGMGMWGCHYVEEAFVPACGGEWRRELVTEWQEVQRVVTRQLLREGHRTSPGSPKQEVEPI